MPRNNSTNRVLVSLLILATSLRLHGLFYSLPLPFAVPDEFGHYLGALYLINNRTIITPYYQIIGTYLTIPFILVNAVIVYITENLSSLNDLRIFLITHPGSLLPSARLLSVIFSIVNLYLVYKLSLQLWRNKIPAYLSTALLSTSLLYLQLSQFARPWMLTIFCFLMTLLALNKKNYLLTAIFTVLAIATHQSGMMVIFVVLYAFFLDLYHHGYKIIKKWLSPIIILILGSISTYFLRKPIDSIGFPEHLQALIQFPPNLPLFLQAISQNVLFFTKTLILHEPAITLLGCLGIYLSSSNKTLKHITLIIFTLTVVIFYSTARSLLPLVICLNIFAGYGLYKLTLIYSRQKFFILSLFLIPNLIFCIRYNFLLKEPSTYFLATQWINKQDTNQLIAIDRSDYYNFIPYKNDVEIIIKDNPQFFSSAYSLVPPSNYRRVFYLDKLNSEEYSIASYFKDYQPEFIINHYFSKSDKYSVINNYHLIKTIYPTNNNNYSLSNMVDNMVTPYPYELLSHIQRTGPFIDIYQKD